MKKKMDLETKKIEQEVERERERNRESTWLYDNNNVYCIYLVYKKST